MRFFLISSREGELLFAGFGPTTRAGRLQQKWTGLGVSDVIAAYPERKEAAETAEQIGGVLIEASTTERKCTICGALRESLLGPCPNGHTIGEEAYSERGGQAREKMIQQLRQDHYELTTLSPRLMPQYRRSVDATRENIRKLLEELGEKL